MQEWLIAAEIGSPMPMHSFILLPAHQGIIRCAYKISEISYLDSTLAFEIKTKLYVYVFNTHIFLFSKAQ